MDSDFICKGSLLVGYKGSGGTVTIPNSVDSIDRLAFKDKHITHHGSLPGAPWGAKSMN